MNTEAYELITDVDGAAEYISRFNNTEALPYMAKLLYWNGEKAGRQYAYNVPHREGDDRSAIAEGELKAIDVLWGAVPGYMADVWRAGFVNGHKSVSKCPHCGGAL